MITRMSFTKKKYHHIITLIFWIV